MSDITLHLGGLVLAAALLLAATIYGVVAIGALLVAWGWSAGAAVRIAGRAGLLSLAGLLLAVLSLALPSSGAGDAAAGILFWVALAAFVAGLVLIALAGAPASASSAATREPPP